MCSINTDCTSLSGRTSAGGVDAANIGSKLDEKSSMYGKKLAAILNKSDYSFEDPQYISSLRDAQPAGSTKNSQEDNMLVKKLACALQQLISQTKNYDSVQETPPTACVTELYDPTNCTDTLVQEKPRAERKRKQRKKKRTKTAKLVKQAGDCICKSVFCKRISYVPKWNSSIAPKLDTETYCKNKCVQSGKQMTTAEMMNWHENIKKRKMMETTEVKSKKKAEESKNCNEEPTKSNISSSAGRSKDRTVQCEKVNRNDLENPSLVSVSGNIRKKNLKETTKLKLKKREESKNCNEESTKSNISSSAGRFVDRKVQREKVYGNDLEKPSSVSVCRGILNTTSSVTTKSLEQKSRKQKVQSSKNSHEHLTKKSSTSAKGNANREEIATEKKRNFSNEDDICRLKNGLLQILDEILKQTRQRLQDK